MLQKISLEREPTLKPEEEDMELFLKRMAAKYVQTRKDLIPRKRSGFLELSMKKLPFEKQVRFQGGKVLEVNRQNLDKDSSLSTDTEEGTHSRIRTSTTSQKHEFPYRKVPTQVPVVNVPPLPAKYFRQIPRKDGPLKGTY